MPTLENKSNIPDDLFNRVVCDDCLVVMQRIPDKSIDMILCDLPYGTTSCKWDTVIPFERLWENYKRIIKNNGAIVLTAAQPFTSALVMSNPDWFKYDICWRKSNSTGHLNAKIMPLRQHEDILVFGKGKINYFPQLFKKPVVRPPQKTAKTQGAYGDFKEGLFRSIPADMGYPRSVIDIPTAYHAKESGLHPTQKPVALFEYLVKTYSAEGDIILDNCAGSGTTGVACINTNRNFVLIEKEPKYVEIIQSRLFEETPFQCPKSDLLENREVFSEISFDDV